MRLGIIVALIPMGMVVLGTAACGGSSDQPSTGERPLVVVSLPLFADFVRQVGGERVEVFALLPSGADPHTFEPTPRDIQRLSEAALVIVNGLGLEGPSLRLMANNRRADTPLVPLAQRALDQGLVAVVEEESAEGQEIEEHAEGNPHLWLDVSVAMDYVKIIRDELSGVDPSEAETYRSNAESYLRELEALGDDLKAQAASIPPDRRKLITSHDAFPYLARYFDLDVVAFAAASPGQEPSPGDLARLQQLVEELGVAAVFVEPQLEAEGRVLQQLAQDIGLEVCTLYSDALDERVQSYIDMMRFNVAEIVRCLGGAAVGY